MEKGVGKTVIFPLPVGRRVGEQRSVENRGFSK